MDLMLNFKFLKNTDTVIFATLKGESEEAKQYLNSLIPLSICKYNSKVNIMGSSHFRPKSFSLGLFSGSHVHSNRFHLDQFCPNCKRGHFCPQFILSKN